MCFAGPGATEATLFYPASETKNHRDVIWSVNERLCTMLTIYIAYFLPLFAATSSDFDSKRWLFPAGDGRPGPLSSSQVRNLIITTMAERVGVDFHPHLFRSPRTGAEPGLRLRALSMGASCSATSRITWSWRTMCRPHEAGGRPAGSAGQRVGRPSGRPGRPPPDTRTTAHTIMSSRPRRNRSGGCREPPIARHRLRRLPWRPGRPPMRPPGRASQPDTGTVQ